MKPDWERLEFLYNQYFLLRESGRDVVYEIEREINNLELIALQDYIIPAFSEQLVEILQKLKCTLEISIQYDGEGHIKYGFGKSGSMAFIQGETSIEKPIDSNPTEINTVKEGYTEYSIKVDDSNKSDIDRYISAFKGMKTARKNGRKHPAKAILIIAIFGCISTGKISESRRVDLNPSLIKAYNTLWDELVPKEWGFECNICHPYMHLSSEEFYELNIRRPIPDMNAPWRLSMVKNHVNYATIDESFWEVATDKTKRDAIIEFLIKEFDLNDSSRENVLEIAEYSVEPENNNLVRSNDSQCPTADEFRSFLLDYRFPKSGHNLSPKAIDSCINALERWRFKKMIYGLANTKNIYEIQSPSILSAIYNEAKFESSIDKKIPFNSLKLYIEFWKQWKEKNAKN